MAAVVRTQSEAKKADPNANHRDPKTGRLLPGCKPGPGRPRGIPDVQHAMYRSWQANAEDYAAIFDAMLRERDPTAWKLFMERAHPAVKQQLAEVAGEFVMRWAGERKREVERVDAVDAEVIER